MNHTIIEDCSPYYIRFMFDGLQDIIDLVRTRPTNMIMRFEGYYHEHYSEDDANTIISMMPMSKKIKFRNKRAALFNTPPGGGCGIHKDGGNAKVSFNMPIEISDNMCLTHWYNDSNFKDLSLEQVGGYSRNIWKDWKKLDQFDPVKTMIAKPNEMILFNTEIYHCWTNQNSLYNRKILTLRAVDTSIYFEQMRKIIFGY
jgi:hypothetical protein